MFWKKHRPRCFWRCSKKAETSCSRCILAMFLLTILNELKNCSKFFEICDKLWQQCVYSNNLLTKILAWQAILYQRGINIVGPNHFWRCGPRPKTSRKTSHFLLNDAMFQRCFEKNIDLDVFDDVWKNPKHRINDASNDVNRPPLGGGHSKRNFFLFQLLHIDSMSGHEKTPNLPNKAKDLKVLRPFVCSETLIQYLIWKPKSMPTWI